MIHIMLVSHGRFCEGLLESLQMVAGEQEGISAVPLLPGESPEAYRNRLESEIKEYESEEGTLVLTDVTGGTPFNSTGYLAKDHKIGMVSGMNMPMLLTLALERSEETTLEELADKAGISSTVGVKTTVFKKGEKKQRAKLSINKNR